MTDVEQLRAAIDVVRHANVKTGWVAVDIVAAAADVLYTMLDRAVTVEWCRTHSRPYEVCPLFEMGDQTACDPQVHTLGPKVLR